MSLLEEAAGRTLRRGGQCSVRALANSDPDLHAELVDALASALPHAAISRALKDRGVVIAQGTLARHRRGDCSCP